MLVNAAGPSVASSELTQCSDLVRPVYTGMRAHIVIKLRGTVIDVKDRWSSSCRLPRRNLQCTKPGYKAGHGKSQERTTMVD
jgi:hypothetical protein